MKNIYTRCSSFQQANELGRFIVRKNFEGLYNDSYRGCAAAIKYALDCNRKDGKPFVFIGVGYSSLVVGRSEDDMCKKNSNTFIEDIGSFKASLKSNRIEISVIESTPISKCAPADLLGKEIWLHDFRSYHGECSNYRYSNRGLELCVDGHWITTLDGETRVTFY